MRSIFVILFILALSPAKAGDPLPIDDAGQRPLDRAVLTASITRDLGPAEKPYIVLKKTDRLKASPQAQPQESQLSHQP